MHLAFFVIIKYLPRLILYIMLLRFIIAGVLGWSMEVLWTGLHSIRKKDRAAVGKTSLWMFPIYGCACIQQQLYPLIAQFALLFRGALYALIIFAVEFVSGWFLRDIANACPWDYSGARFNVFGLVRLDYAPLWMLEAIALERVFAAVTGLGL